MGVSNNGAETGFEILIEWFAVKNKFEIKVRRTLFYVGVTVSTCLATMAGAASLRAESAGAIETIAASSDPQTSMTNARRWIEQGNYSKALSELRPFALYPERYPRHHSDYIVVLFWSGELEQAIRLYEEMPATIPPKKIT